MGPEISGSKWWTAWNLERKKGSVYNKKYNRGGSAMPWTCMDASKTD